MSARQGSFVVLEGADGCGKSTQAKRLVRALRAEGHTVHHVRDPGGTRLAERIRALLLDVESLDVEQQADPAGEENRAANGSGISPSAETYLYMAARAQLGEEIIAPALAAGEIVVCERWTLSTEVYQGLAGGVGADEVRRIGRLAEAGTRPDLVLVLDVAEGEGLARLTGTPDRMESKGDSFHGAVVRGYRELAAGRPTHVVIEGGEPDAVAERILAACRELLAEAHRGVA